MSEALELKCYTCGNFLVPPIYSDHRNYCEKCGLIKLGVKQNELLVNSLLDLELKVKCHLCDKFEGTYMEYLKNHHPCEDEVMTCVYKCGANLKSNLMQAHEKKCKQRKYECYTCHSKFFRHELLKHYKLNKDHKAPKIIVRMKGTPQFVLDIDLLFVLRDEIYNRTGKKSRRISMLHYGRYGDTITNEDINNALEKNTDLTIFVKIFPEK